MATLSIAIDAARARAGALLFKRSTEGVQKDAAKTARDVDRFDKSLDRTGRTATTTARSLGGLAAGFSALAIVRSSAQTIARFEETMATLRGVLNIPTELDERFVRLTETARNLGATTRFTATEAAEGLLFLSRAGFGVEASIAAIPATLNLASAGALELGEAADFASNIVSQFSLAAADTARVVDTLVNSANSANTDVRQLAEAMKFVGPVAGALGIQVEETAATIGVLGDSGIQASLAGTNLRGILSSLLGPSSGAKEAIERLGISLEDLNPEKNDLTQIFQRFGEAQLGAADAVEIFSRRNAGAALILSRNVQKIEELTAANEASTGVAARNAAIVEDTLAGAYRSLLSAIDELVLSSGDAGLAGVLRDVTDEATSAVRILNGTADAATEADTSARLLAEGVTGIGLAVATVATTLGLLSLANPFVAAGAAVAALVIGLSELDRALGKSNDAGEVYRETLESIASAAEHAAEAQHSYRNALLDDDTIALVAATERQAGEIRNALFDALSSGQADPIPLVSLEKLLPESLLAEARGRAREITTVIKNETLGIDALAADTSFKLEAVPFEQAIELLTRAEDELGDRARSLRGTLERELAGGETGPVFEQAIAEIENFQDALERLFSGSSEFREQSRETTEAIESGREAIERYVQALEDEARILTLDTEQQDAARAVLELQSLARAGNVDLTDEQIRKTIELTERVRALKATEESRIADDSQTGRAAEDLQSGLIEAQEAEIAKEKLRELREEEERIERTAHRMGQAITNGLAEFATGGASAQEALAGIAARLSELIIELLVLEPLARSISGALGGIFGGGEIPGSSTGPLTRLPISSAQGNVFERGRVIPFAGGGIFDRPTTFPLAGGATGLAGEAGPEAILPLARGADGKLGVVSQGGGGQQTVVNLTVTGVRDADSFRRSQRAITRDLRRAVSGL